MKGLNLRTFRQDLVRLDSDSSDPLGSIKWEKKLEPYTRQLEQMYDFPKDFSKTYYELSLKHLSCFSFDELCRLKHSTIISMHGSVNRLFEKNAQYEIVRKIESSMWRWGYGQGKWNEVVDAYNNIRRFQLTGFPDFELRLDHTTGYNERGYTKYSRLFIDGVFSFLIYYKGKHVFTLGFSIIAGRKLLIQQVQSAQQKSNRSLYKLPGNRVEFAIDMFSRNFPGYKLFVVDGGSLARKIRDNYLSALKTQAKFLNRNTKRRWKKSYRKDYVELWNKVRHIEDRMVQIESYYQNVGSYRLGQKPLVLNELQHWPVLSSRPSKRETQKVAVACA